MTLTITLPDVTSPAKKISESKTKDIVITILIREHPLTLRKIHQILKNQYNYLVTYQAVHKAVKMLLELKVLKREGKGYSLNEGWIEAVTKFSSELQAVYTKKKPLFGVKELHHEGQVQTLMFNSLKDANEYITDLIIQYFHIPNPKPVYCAHILHFHNTLANTEHTRKFVEATNETLTPAYLLSRHAGKLNEWLASLLQKNPLIKAKGGIDVAKNCDTRVLGDVVVQTYYPEDLKKYIDTIFSEKQSIHELNMNEVQDELYNKPRDIKVVVFYNPEIARQLRKQTLSYFNLKKVAFVNVSGPLLNGPVIIDFVKYLVSKGKFPKKIHDEMMKLNKDYRNGKIMYSTYSGSSIDLYAKGIAGTTVEALSKMAEDFLSSVNIVRPYAKKLIELLRKKGFFIVGISASCDEALKPFVKKQLGLDTFYTTKVDVEQGKYTETLEVHLGKEYAKETVMSSFLYNNEVDYENSLAFGDTLNDVPLLRVVGKPICLNPNEELKEYANSKGWRILTNEDDTIKEVDLIISKKLVYSYLRNTAT